MIAKGGATEGPDDPQTLNRYTYVNNNPLAKSDPTGHCGKVVFGATAVSVMSGDCTKRAYSAMMKAQTTQGKVVSGAVMVLSAVGAVAGWVGGTLLVVAAAAGVVKGAVAAFAARAAGAGATAACADGDCGNEANAALTAGKTLVEQGPRALTQADLGIKGTISQLNGTFSVSSGVANVRIDMIDAKVSNPLQILRSLTEAARAAGATHLRIEAYLSNPRLNDILIQRYGMQPGAGPRGMDIIEIPIK